MSTGRKSELLKNVDTKLRKMKIGYTFFLKNYEKIQSIEKKWIGFNLSFHALLQHFRERCLNYWKFIDDSILINTTLDPLLERCANPICPWVETSCCGRTSSWSDGRFLRRGPRAVREADWRVGVLESRVQASRVTTVEVVRKGTEFWEDPPTTESPTDRGEGEVRRGHRIDWCPSLDLCWRWARRCRSRWQRCLQCCAFACPVLSTRRRPVCRSRCLSCPATCPELSNKQRRHLISTLVQNYKWE